MYYSLFMINLSDIRFSYQLMFKFADKFLVMISQIQIVQ